MPPEPFTTPAERWLLRLFEDHYDEQELAAILERHALRSSRRQSEDTQSPPATVVVGTLSVPAESPGAVGTQQSLW